MAAVKGWKTMWRAGAAVILAGAACVGTYLYLSSRNDDGLRLADNAVVGVLPGTDLEQRRQELQNQLDKSLIAFSINSKPTFASGDAQGNLMIENPGNNAKLIDAKMYLDDTGELIYQSGALAPGSYIPYSKLNKDLEKGTYSATVYFDAYDQETQDYLGQAGAAVQLTVES